MGDAWVYIDESQAPHATGAEAGQPFWLGALITEQPIEQGLIDGALGQLKADPDSVGNTQDEATLGRGYFHASEDSKNAHSWICRAIVDAPVHAKFSATRWFFDRHDSNEYDGAKLHRLTALLSVMTALQDDFETIHVFVASREGSFEQTHMVQWPDYCLKMQLGALVDMPILPTRFPRIDAQLVSPNHPGIQACDFILWAVQRSKPVRLSPTGKSDWLKRLGLQLWADGGAENSAQQALEGILGKGIERAILPPMDSPPPRRLESLDAAERWALVQQIADDVHRAASLAEGNPRIGHLAAYLERASAGCERAHQVSPNELRELLGAMMEAFLLTCHTLPMFDVTDGAAWARVTEKRILAAAFMKGDWLWLPPSFSLRSRDVAAPVPTR
ncbi:hypothetical protein [Polyangium sp. 15x6]|uniref:hypothetical protein n=1 Tax=Polyangium sp. 15x6 TaxID=3042687 RepID=UPI00249B00A6|nr:hypothetical protein [Polyangium sp. 15x6]MDI3286160.1 hypothetical protein [Polyangium sp. 15x6]